MKFSDGFIIVRCRAAVNQGDAVREEKTSNATNPFLNVERGGAGRATRAVLTGLRKSSHGYPASRYPHSSLRHCTLRPACLLTFSIRNGA